jgi:hypothetical protein
MSAAHFGVLGPTATYELFSLLSATTRKFSQILRHQDQSSSTLRSLWNTWAGNEKLRNQCCLLPRCNTPTPIRNSKSRGPLQQVVDHRNMPLFLVDRNNHRAVCRRRLGNQWASLRDCLGHNNCHELVGPFESHLYHTQRLSWKYIARSRWAREAYIGFLQKTFPYKGDSLQHNRYCRIAPKQLANQNSLAKAQV